MDYYNKYIKYCVKYNNLKNFFLYRNKSGGNFDCNDNVTDINDLCIENTDGIWPTKEACIKSNVCITNNAIRQKKNKDYSDSDILKSIQLIRNNENWKLLKKYNIYNDENNDNIPTLYDLERKIRIAQIIEKNNELLKKYNIYNYEKKDKLPDLDYLTEKIQVIELIESNMDILNENKNIYINYNITELKNIIEEKNKNRERLNLICTKDKETCEKSYINMTALIQPYTKLKTISQGCFLRDFDKFEKKYEMNIIITLLKEMKFDFHYEDINVSNSTYKDENIDGRYGLRIINENIIKNKINNIVNKNSNKIIFIAISIKGHKNIHIIVPSEGKKYVYIYEPHHPKSSDKPYMYEEQYANFYSNGEYTLVQLPNYVLQQQELPLCYMYVMHFFMLILLFPHNNAEFYNTNNYNNIYDDIYIIKFTRDILKLTKEYKLIDDLVYYLLTNNIYEVQELLNTRKLNSYYINFITSDDMINMIINKYKESDKSKDNKNINYDTKVNDKTYNLSIFENIASLYFFKEEEEVYYAKERILIKAIIHLDNNVISDLLYGIYNFSNPKRILQIFKNKNINFNKKNSKSEIILLKVTIMNRKDIVELLLKNDDIHVNIKNIQGNTALHIAMHKKYIDIVKLLLKNDKVNVNVQDSNEQTALHIATINENSEIVELLLTNNIDVNIQDFFKQTALHIATGRQYSKIIKLLLANNNININLQNSSDETALHIATINQNLYIIKLLLANNNININLQDTYGDTALHTAIDRRNIEIVELLLKNNKVDVNIKNRYSITALHMATMIKNLDIVELLLTNNNININLQDKNGDTALHIATMSQNVNIVELLLNYKIDINLQNGIGETALNIATKKNYIKIKNLIESKVQLDPYTFLLKLSQK